MRDPGEWVQTEAVETLGDLTDRAGLGALRQLASSHPSEHVRKKAAETLDEMAPNGK